MDMRHRHGKLLLLSVLAGVLMLPVAAHADDEAVAAETKPPIIVKQNGTRYIFTSQDEKFRSMLLNSKNLHIHTKPKKDDFYYRHHKYIEDHENYDERDAAHDSGYAAGYFLTKDRD
jgi:hypothetical protein